MSRSICGRSFPVWSATRDWWRGLPLCAYLHHQMGAGTGISCIDSTKLIVCKHHRISQHRVFAAQAQRGKSSTGWVFGCKLHLVVSDQGEILAWCLTAGNGDDRRPVPQLVHHLVGKLFGDKGYLSAELSAHLQENDFHLLTQVRKNMAPRPMDPADKALLRLRASIESINHQLNNISQIEHTRQRSPLNFLVTLVCGLIAYSHQPRKPSLHLEWNLLAAA